MTHQEDKWSSEFGKEYNLRNDYTVDGQNQLSMERFGLSRDEINLEFIGNLSRDIKILEIGCNFGGQLNQLQSIGFKNLYGIELQWDAVERAKNKTTGINIIQASGFDIPYKDNYFDLVFTSGVLIHINPDNLKNVFKEMVRVSNQYIWGFEYFNEEFTELPYRGQGNLMWKGDYQKLFQSQFPELSEVKRKIYPYLIDSNRDIMYLLKK